MMKAMKIHLVISKTNQYDGDYVVSSNVVVEAFSTMGKALNRKDEIELQSEDVDALQECTFVTVIESDVL